MRRTSSHQVQHHDQMSENMSHLSSEELAHVTGGGRVYTLFEDYGSDSRDDTPADIH